MSLLFNGQSLDVTRQQIECLRCGRVRSFNIAVFNTSWSGGKTSSCIYCVAPRADISVMPRFVVSPTLDRVLAFAAKLASRFRSAARGWVDAGVDDDDGWTR